MTFQIKSFLAITASMINRMRTSQKEVTDFNVGSVARSMLEAPAQEIDAFYQEELATLQAAIPVAVFTSFNFPALPAQKATGIIRMTITPNADPVSIPANTRFQRTSGGMAFFSVEDATIDGGDTVIDLNVAADAPGVAGNLISGTTFIPSPSPAGFISAVALGDFRNGAEAETLDEQRERFNGFISSLARGTPAALAYGLTLVKITDALGNTIERVARSNVIEPYLTNPNAPTAYVEIYIHNGVGNTSSSLLNRAVEVIHGYTLPDGTKIPGWKAAGVRVNLRVAEEDAIPIAGVISLIQGQGFVFEDVREDVEAIIADYITRLDVGEEVQVAEIVTRAKRVTGVYDFALTSPAVNVEIARNRKAMPGTMTMVSSIIVLRPPSISAVPVFGSPTVTL